MGRGVKIFICILLVAIIATLALVVGLNFNKIKDNTQLYTYDEIQDAYAKGKKDSEDLLNRKDEQLKNYQDELANANKSSAEKDKQLAEKDSTIAGLNKDKQDLTNANNNLTERNEALEGENSRLTDLVGTYEEAMPNYCDENHRTVTYKVGDRVISTSVVEVGATLTEAVEATFPSDCYDTFNYWEINGVQTNPVGYVVNDHTTFVANVTKRYKVYTTISGVRTENIVESLTDLTTPTETIDGLASRFNGWKMNDELITNLGLIAISNDMELVADFSQQIELTVNWYAVLTGQGDNTTHPVYKTKKIKCYVGDSLTWADVGIERKDITYNGKKYGLFGAYYHMDGDPLRFSLIFRETGSYVLNRTLGVYYFDSYAGQN